jgi:hypothetical protein
LSLFGLMVIIIGIVDDNGDVEMEEESLAQRRGRRSRGDKNGKFAALEKLRGLKGSKNKYEVKDG